MTEGEKQTGAIEGRKKKIREEKLATRDKGEEKETTGRA